MKKDHHLCEKPGHDQWCLTGTLEHEMAELRDAFAELWKAIKQAVTDNKFLSSMVFLCALLAGIAAAHGEWVLAVLFISISILFYD